MEEKRELLEECNFPSRITVRHTLEVKATKVLQNSSDNIQLPDECRWCIGVKWSILKQ